MNFNKKSNLLRIYLTLLTISNYNLYSDRRKCPLKLNIEKYRDYINDHKSNYLPDQ